MIKKATMLFGLMSISNAAMEENEVNAIAGPLKQNFIQDDLKSFNQSLDNTFLNIDDRVTFQEENTNVVLTGAVVRVNPLAIQTDDTDIDTVYKDTISLWSVQRLYNVGDQVRVRKSSVDEPNPWKRGEVTQTDPSLLVKVDGTDDPLEIHSQSVDQDDYYVEYDNNKDYNIEDRVRVSDSEDGPWREGTVKNLNPLKVHADGDNNDVVKEWAYVQRDWEHKFDKLVNQASEYVNLQKQNEMKVKFYSNLYKKNTELEAQNENLYKKAESLEKEKTDLEKEKAGLEKEKADLEEKNGELAKKDHFEDQSKKNYNLMIVFAVLFAICAIAVIALAVVLVKKNKQNA